MWGARLKNTLAISQYPEHIYDSTGRLLITPHALTDSTNKIVSLLTAEERQAIEKVDEWLRTTIMATVQKKDKRESMCPFVKPSINRKLIYFSVARLKNPADPAEIKKEARIHADILEKMPAKNSNEKFLRCLLLLLPQTPDPLLEQCMPPERNSVKTEMMRRGIMIGEFFPSDTMNATWDKGFRINSSPVPFYVVRSFIENDGTFINHIPVWKEIFDETFKASRSAEHGPWACTKRWLQGLISSRNK